MHILNPIPFQLDLEQLSAEMRIRPGSSFSQDFSDLVAQVQAHAVPKIIYKAAYIDAKGADTVTLEGVTFTSRALRGNLDGLERVFAYVATCGAEVDSLISDPEDRIRKYWLHYIKLKLLEIGHAYLASELERRYQVTGLSSMNPGSGEASVWPIEQQPALFSLFGDVEGLIGVRLTPQHIMIPEISTSGVLFPAESTYHNCQLCQRERCPSRRAPFDAELWAALNPA